MLREYMPWLATMDPFVKMGVTLALAGVAHSTTNALMGNVVRDKVMDGGDVLLKKNAENKSLQGAFMRAAGHTAHGLSDLTQTATKLFIAGTTAWWATNYYMEAKGLPSAALDVAKLPLELGKTALHLVIERW